MFTADLIEHFETIAGVSVEGVGPTLVFYRHSTRLDSARVRHFMEEGFAILGLFRDEEPTE